jgi:hypothetical protein
MANKYAAHHVTDDATVENKPEVPEVGTQNSNRMEVSPIETERTSNKPNPTGSEQSKADQTNQVLSQQEQKQKEALERTVLYGQSGRGGGIPWHVEGPTIEVKATEAVIKGIIWVSDRIKNAGKKQLRNNEPKGSIKP